MAICYKEAHPQQTLKHNEKPPTRLGVRPTSNHPGFEILRLCPGRCEACSLPQVQLEVFTQLRGREEVDLDTMTMTKCSSIMVNDDGDSECVIRFVFLHVPEFKFVTQLYRAPVIHMSKGSSKKDARTASSELPEFIVESSRNLPATGTIALADTSLHTTESTPEHSLLNARSEDLYDAESNKAVCVCITHLNHHHGVSIPSSHCKHRRHAQ